MKRYVQLMATFGASMVLIACSKSPPLPTTYPAAGTVSQGGKAMKGGSIRFSLASDPLLVVTSEIGDDGAFKLRTAKEDRTATGAPEGEYEVTVQPPAVEQKAGAGQGKHVEPIVLKQKYTVKPEDNTFKIEVP